MTFDKRLVAVVVIALLIGFNWGGGRWERHPFLPVPLPTPAPAPDKPDRPVVRWIVRAAKSLLWVAAFADPPPAESHDSRIVQHAMGADGYPVIDHARGL
jgi:hypothetical protein